MQSGLTARNRFVDYVARARNETPPSQSANKTRLITSSNSIPRRAAWYGEMAIDRPRGRPRPPNEAAAMYNK